MPGDGLGRELCVRTLLVIFTIHQDRKLVQLTMKECSTQTNKYQICVEVKETGLNNFIET